MEATPGSVERIVHLSKTRKDCNFGHVFHNVFVDLYYLQMINQPAGAYVLDDYWWRGVATATRHFQTNLGWRPHAIANGTPGALRLPYQPVAPAFEELTTFWPEA